MLSLELKTRVEDRSQWKLGTSVPRATAGIQLTYINTSPLMILMIMRVHTIEMFITTGGLAGMVIEIIGIKSLCDQNRRL